jgi:type VI secretion system protein ImpK
MPIMVAEATRGAAMRPGTLAIALQDALTVTVRLRRGESVATDAETFRNRIKTILAGVTREMDGRGFDRGNVKLAVFGFTAFLDESVLNSTDPIFRDWPRRPLQEEVFGEHTGGEKFYQNLEALLRQSDSGELADVLEVYLLCLLLGFHGRYPAGGPELDQFASVVGDRIRRIRGPLAADHWRLPESEKLPRRKDRVTQALTGATLVAVVGLAVLFVALKFSLSSGLDAVRAAAAGMGAG